MHDIRRDFPLLSENKVVYLDNAATSQKPACVLDAERAFYEKYNANPFRGLYEMSEKATGLYEEARGRIQHFLHAQSSDEIIFTRNATEGLNLAAYSLGSLLLKPGDEVVVSILEHHSNLIPWQQAAKRADAVVRFLECGPEGDISEEELKKTLTDKTRIVALTQMSNVLGGGNDVRRIAQLCHEKGIVLVVDGAQSVPHMPVDVTELDMDFLAFSGHKMLAPMGIGVLYGKKEFLEKMPPFLTGGEMMESVTIAGTVFASAPHKFEAGTVNAPGAVGLAEAIRYLEDIGMQNVMERERQLTAFAMEGMKKIPGLQVLGAQEPDRHHGIISFTLDGVHPHDVAAVLAADKIAVRAGHHCAQPLLAYLKNPSVTRASLAFYNTESEIQSFLNSLKQIRRKMGYGK